VNYVLGMLQRALAREGVRADLQQVHRALMTLEEDFVTLAPTFLTADMEAKGVDAANRELERAGSDAVFRVFYEAVMRDALHEVVNFEKRLEASRQAAARDVAGTLHAFPEEVDAPAL
jgi:hypothetical protein